MDDRSLKNLLTIYGPVQHNFDSFLFDAQILAGQEGLEYKVICGARTYDQQSDLYAQGRTKPGKIVTNAKPGYSFHNFGLAVDCGVFKNGKYLDETKPSIAEAFHKKASVIAKKHGLRWGGDFKTFKDTPHFELDTKVTLAELRNRKAKNLPLL